MPLEDEMWWMECSKIIPMVDTKRSKRRGDVIVSGEIQLQ